jgi:hypothetical protein
LAKEAWTSGIALWSWAIVAGIIAASVLISRVRKPSVVDRAREQNKLKMLEIWGKVWPVTSVVLFILAVVFVIQLIRTLLAWLDEKAKSNYADSKGIFPVKAIRGWKWVRTGEINILKRSIGIWLPANFVVYHDPNRTAGATTIYAPTGVGEVVMVKQVMAEDVSPEQMRITQGAQLTQIAAASSGPVNPARQAVTRAMRGPMPHVNIYNELDGIGPPVLSPSPPPAQLLPINGSHIERLMREQGELIPGVAEEDEPGDATI